MNGRAWTDADDASIRATIDLPATEAAAQLGRSVLAVEKRRSRLGVVRPCGRKRPDSVTWTAEEDAIVIATRDRPIRDVAARIPNHTEMAVRLRRTTLKRRGLF